MHEPYVKNMDFIIGGVVWELKSPTGSGKSTISHQFERARAQGASRLILDMARTDTDESAVLEEMVRRLMHSSRLTDVMQIRRSGQVVRVTKLVT